MNTPPDPPDPADPADPVRELLFGTYQPSRAGVEMTEVLNKLPQISHPETGCQGVVGSDELHCTLGTQFSNSMQDGTRTSEQDH